MGIAFRVSFVTSADDRARIISGLSIKCFNIGEKRKITPVKSRIIWEHVGLLPWLCYFDGIRRFAVRLIRDVVESNEDALYQRMGANRLFTGSNHIDTLLITMPLVVVVMIGYDLEQIDQIRHGFWFLKATKAKKRLTASERGSSQLFCICYVPVAFSTSCFHRPEHFEIVLITLLEILLKQHSLSSKRIKKCTTTAKLILKKLPLHLFWIFPFRTKLKASILSTDCQQILPASFCSYIKTISHSLRSPVRLAMYGHNASRSFVLIRFSLH